MRVCRGAATSRSAHCETARLGAAGSRHGRFPAVPVRGDLPPLGVRGCAEHAFSVPGRSRRCRSRHCGSAPVPCPACGALAGGLTGLPVDGAPPRSFLRRTTHAVRSVPRAAPSGPVPSGKRYPPIDRTAGFRLDLLGTACPDRCRSPRNIGARARSAHWAALPSCWPVPGAAAPSAAMRGSARRCRFSAPSAGGGVARIQRCCGGCTSVRNRA